MLKSLLAPSLGALLLFASSSCSSPAGSASPNAGELDSGSAPDSEPASLCLPWEERCAGRCVQLDSDPAHCGACERPCGDGQVCVEGRCLPRCAPSEERCDEVCVDPEWDRLHCGRCGNSCGPGLRCYEGSCQERCPEESLVRCDGRCVDLSGDAENCRLCGRRCDALEVCVGGRCESLCGGDFVICNGVCVNLQDNTHHCGACGRSCGLGAVCEGGHCHAECGASHLFCDGACVDPQRDPEHCGGCERACPRHLSCEQGLCSCPRTDEEDCGEGCHDLESDPQHCGGCARACAPETVCLGGECSCPEPAFRVCGGRCVDLRNDPEHCGACGAACDSLDPCRNRRCGGAALFTGVRTELPEEELLGWELCWRGRYGEPGPRLDELLERCNRPLLLLACRPLGSPTLTVAASGLRHHVLEDTGTQIDRVHVHNGVSWYFHGEHSWGFAPEGESVNRAACDTANTAPAQRLCWHTRAGALTAGWRCGERRGLNDAQDWERLIYH